MKLYAPQWPTNSLPPGWNATLASSWTTRSCDVCSKTDLQRFARVTVTNSHYGRGGVWPGDRYETAIECCSIECVRKAAAEIGRSPLTEDELQALSEQKQPRLADELATAKTRIAQLEASLAQRPVAPDPVVTKNELADLLRQLLQERRGFNHG